MASSPKENYSVLLVDDSEDDRLFMRRALRDHAKLKVVGEVCDGEEAIAYLEGRAGFCDREKHPFPDVLLLDLKMPRKTGFDVLRWLQTRSFKELVVVVVSGSLLPQDIAQSLALGAHAYHRKSVSKDEHAVMFQKIEESLGKLKVQPAV
jgi:CheY-like chemotaxis protein